MNHPQVSVLQDYFENELTTVQSTVVKEHLLNCDHCTSILAQMAKVDSSLKSIPQETVSLASKDRIFSDAKFLLSNKRAAIEAEARMAASRTHAREAAIRASYQLWKDTWEDIRVPALQLASVSMVVAVLIAANRDEQVTVHKPFSEEVVVTTRTGESE